MAGAHSYAKLVEESANIVGVGIADEEREHRGLVGRGAEEANARQSQDTLGGIAQQVGLMGGNIVHSDALHELDGTAKGGVVIGISDQLKVPVKYIGLGEGMEDLQLFNRRQFVDSLFGDRKK